jgi:hypothetical protein
MLSKAMDVFQVAKREHNENVKAQYTDKKGITGAKNYFRASEMGMEDRKIIYGFFAHNLPKQSKSAQNLRQLENGDFVHDRYQTAWEQMGVLISMEERLSSKDDEYLAQFPWEWAGHYDGLLDMNIVRAHALNMVTVGSTYNEETEQWEIDVELDPAYANSIGIFDEEGNIAEDYVPITMVADIKTMNPWGFKAIKDKGDVSNIGGYIDQIMFYMYMHNTPYGSIFIESKDNNDTVEVQIVWKDMHEGEEYTFEEDLHGKPASDIVRVMVSSERFFGGGEAIEGAVPRISRLWAIKEALEKAEAEGDQATIAQLFPERCADKPDGFPCSWGHKTSKPTYCEFYDHCWSKVHGGRAVKPVEALPEENKWVFEDDNGEVVVDNRKVPAGIDYNGFITLVEMGALDYTKFLADIPFTIETDEEVEDTSLNADNLFGAGGELRMDLALAKGDAPTEATEYLTEDNQKAIDCVNCGKQNTYQKLGNGNTKKCTHCKHTNRVVRA